MDKDELKEFFDKHEQTIKKIVGKSFEHKPRSGKSRADSEYKIFIYEPTGPAPDMSKWLPEIYYNLDKEKIEVMLRQGDKVKIKNLTHKDSLGGMSITPSMRGMSGMEVTIQEVIDNNRFLIEEDRYHCYWTSEMFHLPVEPYEDMDACAAEEPKAKTVEDFLELTDFQKGFERRGYRTILGTIKDVIFVDKDRKTIVKFSDGRVEVAVASPEDHYDHYTGFLVCLFKRMAHVSSGVEMSELMDVFDYCESKPAMRQCAKELLKLDIKKEKLEAKKAELEALKAKAEAQLEEDLAFKRKVRLAVEALSEMAEEALEEQKEEIPKIPQAVELPFPPSVGEAIALAISEMEDDN